MADILREHRVTLAAYRRFSEVVEVDGAIVLHVPEAPELPSFNRVVGLGVERPASEADVDAALEAIGSGVTFYVPVAPGARPAELSGWLHERGLQPSWSGMAFRRGVQPPSSRPTALRFVEVSSDEHAAAFAAVVRLAYRLPEALVPRLASMWQRGWECWVAFAGDEPAAAAALFAQDGIAYLGFAGTVPQHRCQGAQSAMLATRIARAAQLGCDVVLVETSYRGPNQPSSAYRNMVRAGFQEIAVTDNWLGER